MRVDQHLRSLAQVRTQQGKLSREYAAAVLDFCDHLVDPGTGEVLGKLATCPSCTADGQELLDFPFRYVRLGCADCGDVGLACRVCRNALWIRKGPPGYDPHDLTDNRIATIIPCPQCAEAVTNSRGDTVYVRNLLRATFGLEAWYVEGSTGR